MAIDILDIKSGNVSSVQHALTVSGLRSRIVNTIDAMSSECLLLPGVGNAKNYMNKLYDQGLDQQIIDYANSGRQIIGICLGFQIMCDWCEEGGGTPGLGLIKAKAERLRVENLPTQNTGWRPIKIAKDLIGTDPRGSAKVPKRSSTLRGRVYYNHEFGVRLMDEKKDHQAWTTGISDVGLENYCSIYRRDNIVGFQFHPERSQLTGIRLLKLVLSKK